MENYGTLTLEKRGHKDPAAGAMERSRSEISLLWLRQFPPGPSSVLFAVRPPGFERTAQLRHMKAVEAASL
ncbi:uncharacterized protein V6R79_019056 [Siganus canaliculatus]